MDKREQVTRWVQKKIEKVLDEDLKLNIVEENSPFDVETYVNTLLDKYFNESEIENLKESLSFDSYYELYYLESDNSLEVSNSTQNSLALESNDHQTFSIEEITGTLENESEEVKKKFLRVLETSAEDFISHNFYDKIIEILQKNLNKTKSREMFNLILKIFQKVLKGSKKPQFTCKGFTSIAEVTANQIDLFNQKVHNSLEKICDKKLLEVEFQSFRTSNISNSVNPEVLVKLMWLLIDCQLEVRIKGIRFNESRFREIIFSFIHLLNYTTSTSGHRKVSGLELISILDPKAIWCRYWCHTAVGRTLLCSALRKYKNFFIYIIEIMLKHMKVEKSKRLPSAAKDVNLHQSSTKFVHNVPNSVKPFKETSTNEQTIKKIFFKKNADQALIDNDTISVPGENLENRCAEELKKMKEKSTEWIIQGIPRRIVNEAVFFHSVSLVSCLIKFRCGRALFPVHTNTKKRLLNVQDLSLLIIEHFENYEYYECVDSKMYHTSNYQDAVLEILNDFRKLKTHIDSSRLMIKRQ